MSWLKSFFQTETKPRPKSNFAQILSAVVGAVALAGIYYQVSLTRLNSLQSSARQVYLSYSQATLQYPDLAYPDFERLKADHKEYNRYKVYVAFMLTAYDEILPLDLGVEWEAALRYDIKDHMPYLCEQNDPLFWATFGAKIRALVGMEKARYCSQTSGTLIPTAAQQETSRPWWRIFP